MFVIEDIYKRDFKRSDVLRKKKKIWFIIIQVSNGAKTTGQFKPFFFFTRIVYFRLQIISIFRVSKGDRNSWRRGQIEHVESFQRATMQLLAFPFPNPFHTLGAVM